MLYKMTVLSALCRLVIEALKDVDGDRKCFRMVGGVLVERTVKDVLPAMTNNYEQVMISDFMTATKTCCI